MEISWILEWANNPSILWAIIICMAGVLLWHLVFKVDNGFKTMTNGSISKESAIDTLKKHQIDVHYYLASVGSRDNEELCRALDFLSGQGFIMTDSEGHLVGKVAKARLSNHEKALQQRARFKVINNEDEKQ